MEIRTIQKNGNSLAINLPRKYVDAGNLSLGDFVVIKLDANKRIIIEKLKPHGQKADAK